MERNKWKADEPCWTMYLIAGVEIWFEWSRSIRRTVETNFSLMVDGIFAVELRSVKHGLQRNAINRGKKLDWFCSRFSSIVNIKGVWMLSARSFSYSTLDDFWVVWSALVTLLRDLLWSCVGSNWGSTHFLNTENRSFIILESRPGRTLVLLLYYFPLIDCVPSSLSGNVCNSNRHEKSDDREGSHRSVGWQQVLQVSVHPGIFFSFWTLP